MGFKWQAVVVGVVAGCVGWIWLALDWVQVTDSEMAPSLIPGDWLLLGPGSPLLGDVVALEDPAWPDRQVFRRVLGIPGATVGLEDGLVVAQGKRLRIREMGRDEHTLTLTEDDGYLVRRRLIRERADQAPTEVQAEHLWLLADNRVTGLDSRWWGTVSADRVDRIVWLRIGEPGKWRRRIAVRGRDGPWKKPTPQVPVEPG